MRDVRMYSVSGAKVRRFRLALAHWLVILYVQVTRRLVASSPAL